MTVKLMPFDRSDEVIELSKGSNIFEKQVLPIGKFNYKGKELNITPDYIKEIVRAFDEKALDQTPFALADERNSHDVDDRPDRYGGEVLKFVPTPKGLKAVYKLTDKSAEMVRQNPKLGVSARIHEGYERIDGRSWPVVVDQVLGTLNPKVTGLEPWKEIKLSNLQDKDNVEDYSNGDWKSMGTQDDKNKKPEDEEKVTLTKEEYDQFKKLLATKSTDSDDDDDVDDDDDDLNYSEEDLKKALEELEKEGEPAKLSNEQNSKVIQLSREVAEGRFERDALAWKQAGVPPKLIELARPVLSSYEEVNVIQLSNGREKTIDAREVVKKILDETRGTVDLSNEEGHSNRDQSGENQEFEQLRKGLLDEVNQF